MMSENNGACLFSLLRGSPSKLMLRVRGALMTKCMVEFWTKLLCLSLLFPLVEEGRRHILPVFYFLMWIPMEFCPSVLLTSSLWGDFSQTVSYLILSARVGELHLRVGWIVI